MKNWQKILIVFVSGGIVWASSFVIGQKPELAQILGSVNAAIVGACAYFTGFTKTTA
jgi:hypothetical protein